jgi:hypothetical protein
LTVDDENDTSVQAADEIDMSDQTTHDETDTSDQTTHDETDTSVTHDEIDTDHTTLRLTVASADATDLGDAVLDDGEYIFPLSVTLRDFEC